MGKFNHKNDTGEQILNCVKDGKSYDIAATFDDHGRIMLKIRIERCDLKGNVRAAVAAGYYKKSGGILQIEVDPGLFTQINENENYPICGILTEHEKEAIDEIRYRAQA